MIVATLPAALSFAGVTDTTPGVAATAARSLSTGVFRALEGGPSSSTPFSAASRFGLGTFATTSSGPLKPSPKPCASSS